MDSLPPPAASRPLLLVLVAGLGVIVFVVGLGDTGIVDETPALFAASARRMAESGDWLMPQVNGLPRYDKPPLVYWLMGGLYALPGSGSWDPLGSWSARLPAALASIVTMVALADTLLRWPQPLDSAAPLRPSDRLVPALSAALAFALGPLMLVWGRTEVSDAPFTATLALSLLLAWRTMAAAAGSRWWSSWCCLALAVLCKGPAAIVLSALTLALFWLLGGDGSRILQRLRPLAGLSLTLLLALPWYALALLREGEAYWRSFFGYHNLQRFTQVVNNHQQAPWYFLAMLLLASLPFTPLLLLSLRRVGVRARSPEDPAHSLRRFAAAWLLATLLFFSLAATKLPSYWLVATPAAALLVALAPAASRRRVFSKAIASEGPRALEQAMRASAVLLALISALLAFPSAWLSRIQDPTLPGLALILMEQPWLRLTACVTLAAAMHLWLGRRRPQAQRLLRSQATLLLIIPLLLLPLGRIGDQIRQEPIRRIAAVVRNQPGPAESVAMVGLNKPSLHFYSERTIVFEGRSAQALVNLADRLTTEVRPGLLPRAASRQRTVLLVIDDETARRPHWQGLQGVELARQEPYRLLRLDRLWLEQRARSLQAEGRRPSWRDPRPERL